MVAAREALKVKKQRLDGAMLTIQRLAPDLVAVSRRAQVDQTDAAARAHVAARRAKRLAGLGSSGGGGGSSSGGSASAGQLGSSPGSAGVDPESPIMTFEFTGKNGDNNGYIYWLGTEGKTKKFENPHTAQRLRVTSSGKLALWARGVELGGLFVLSPDAPPCWPSRPSPSLFVQGWRRAWRKQW
jgi:hypothetical protein